MKLYSFLVISCVLCFSSLQAIPTAYAQDQTGAGGPDKIKAVLLRPAGWIGDWINPNTGNSGRSEIVFEDRGEKVVAKIQITVPGQASTGILSCERDVIISPDTVKFDGCRDQGIILLFDPNDREYTLKSKTKTANGYEWKLKAK